MSTRWDEWFAAENLAKDQRILAALPSRSAAWAAQAFLAGGKRFILDLACGIGRDTFYLERCGLTVIGIDAALNGLRVAQQRKIIQGARTGLITADARYLPFPDRTFEGIYCFGLLHEFTGAGRNDDVAAVMSEIQRLLCDGGIVVLTVLAGEADAGLPAVQLFTRQMFEQTTHGLRAIAIKQHDDIGCTGRSDYRVWYGLFTKERVF